jgi:hypothetical protein
MTDDIHRKRFARARLEALRNNPPTLWDEIEVSNFHDIVTALENAFSRDFSSSRIPLNRMEPRLVSKQRDPRSGRHQGRAQYADKLCCRGPFAQQQIDGLYSYLESLDLGGKEPRTLAGVAGIHQRSEEAGSGSSHLGIQVRGPDGVQLLIEPYDGGYVWQILNGPKAAENVVFEIVSVQRFDSQTAEFMEPTTGFRAPWPKIRTMSSRELRENIILVAFEGNALRMGQRSSENWLPWPNGDPSKERRWILHMSVVGLSQAWPIELDLRWTAGTKSLELIEYRASMPRRPTTVTDQHALNPEAIVSLIPGKEYPKYMYHPTQPPVLVNSKREQTELGAGWSEADIHQMYPRWKYHWSGNRLIVKDAAEEAALGGGWADTPAAFHAYQGPRKPKTEHQDPTQWVDGWPVPDLADDVRRKIKAQLHRADAAFWNSPDAASADADAMRRAFREIAKVLSEAGLLTEGLLKNAIPALVWDSAIAGGWYRWAAEKAEPIFPEPLGHYWVWRDDSKDWNVLFHSETREWLAWLLENSHEEIAKPGQSVKKTALRSAATGHRRAPSARGQAKRGKIRSTWLDGRRSQMKWDSDLDIEQNSGPSYNTIQRYRSGRTSTRENYVRGRLASAFGCPISEVPE